MMSILHNSQINRLIDEEHVRLGKTMANLRRMLATRSGEPDKIAVVFHDLAQRILEHFEHEEHGGYFAEATEHAPRLKRRANELLDQHLQMASHVERLQELAATKKTSDEWWHVLQDEFGRFLECFRAHETAEDRLIQEAYGDDIGTGD